MLSPAQPLAPPLVEVDGVPGRTGLQELGARGVPDSARAALLGILAILTFGGARQRRVRTLRRLPAIVAAALVLSIPAAPVTVTYSWGGTLDPGASSTVQKFLLPEYPRVHQLDVTILGVDPRYELWVTVCGTIPGDTSAPPHCAGRQLPAGVALRQKLKPGPAYVQFFNYAQNSHAAIFEARLSYVARRYLAWWGADAS